MKDELDKTWRGKRKSVNNLLVLVSQEATWLQCSVLALICEAAGID